MKINYHIHTAFSGDLIRLNRLDETPEKVAKAAIEKGFGEICITDHLIIGYPNTSSLYSDSMDASRLPEYFREVSRVSKKYPSVKIRIGAEIDWLPEKAEEIKRVIGQHPFDCILGAVHSLNGTKVKQGEEREKFWGMLSPKEVYGRYAAYYKAIQEMAKSRLFDVVAHLDLIKTDGYFPKKSILPIIKETIKVIAENGLCIEINTVGISETGKYATVTEGMRKQIKEMYPSLEILKLCRNAGIPVTIGTDAHKAERLDFGFGDAMKMIKEAGYTELAVFEKRKRSFVKI